MTKLQILRQSSRLLDVALADQYSSSEPPLRAELFNADQMEVHGSVLAASHRLSASRRPDRLMSRLIDNYGVLLSTRSLLTQTVKAQDPITPAGEWLLDNFHLIEEQIRTAKKNFPRGYSRELPILNGDSQDFVLSEGMPRVYDIALEAIAHGDGRIDPESLNRFIAAYQNVVDLNLGELWAIPIMLRFALIENLRRVSARIAAGLIDRKLAAHWATAMIATAQTDPKSLILTIADMARSNPPMVNSFVAELARRLQGHSTALALPLTWISQTLAESNQTIEQLVQSETQSQASNQVSISNTIASLRFVGSNDWREFVASMSTVERTLRLDPTAVYEAMDFATRDLYRHKVEALAKRAKVAEVAIAKEAVALAVSGPQMHVGYYLIDQGLDLLEAAIERIAPTPSTFYERLHRRRRKLIAVSKKLSHRRNCWFYLGGIVLLTAFFTIQFFDQARSSDLAPWIIAIIAIPALCGSSQLAVALINWLATLFSQPSILPRMDYSEGIASSSKTLIVVPTLITNPDALAELCEALEVRYLANRDDNLQFGLLTDFTDSQFQTMKLDNTLLAQVCEAIESLNRKYPLVLLSGSGLRFNLFHRPRIWNESEQVWMGYERKRGKLAALNSLLQTGRIDQFETIIGDVAELRSIRYVITLDTDTQLPRDSARNLVATMAHPLNNPRFDEKSEIVSAGFGILQPRVMAGISSNSRSRYSELWCNDLGIDPYTRAVSDVYQDLFEEGSFIGKGIYEVAAFERSLDRRFPENRILSHDLLEGCYARAGLVSDVQLFEDYPSQYSADVSRRHRWIRGDWQIAAWLFRKTPSLEKNSLSILSQWKILDNLRRSLVPVSLMALLIVGWTLVQSSWQWTLSVLSIIFLTPLVTASISLLRKGSDVVLGQHCILVVQSAYRQLCQTLFTLACLPFEAFFSMDAIVRTLIRVHITHRKLLEWRPSASRVESSISTGGMTTELRLTWQAMWISSITAIATTIALVLSKPSILAIALPILLLWFFSPLIVYWVGRPISRKKIELNTEQTLFLRLLARKTWRYFETFVSAQDHWLPPDNFQEHPIEVVAHRTSPTNMGLSLLANLSAYDFGYLSAGLLIERTQNALQTMEMLERFEGHFYNWYDTVTLQALAPRYVSSVDSGNLSGHLLTLAPGLLELIDQPVIGSQTFEGISDTFLNFQAANMAAPLSNKASISAMLSAKDYAAMQVMTERLRIAINSAVLTGLSSVASAMRSLNDIQSCASEIEMLLAVDSSRRFSAAMWWLQALGRQCTDALNDCSVLAVASIDQPIPILRNVGSAAALRRIELLQDLVRKVNAMSVVNYDLVYDKVKHLMAVGYSVEHHRRDSGHYDLLASEARLASFVAISQGSVPQENWFALGRLLTGTGADPVLLSWSGSMFEYLMPMLVMPTFASTLLEKTCVNAVGRQISYGKARGVPWGISESGYNAVDTNLNYQYLAFGVPGLGLKRGLSDDLVIAPYASALALMVSPQAACSNMQRLAAEGFEGDFGLYEAIDFTASRVPRGQTNAVVRSFMAHHQAMSFLSFDFVLHDQPMQRRFEANLAFQATALLLHERIPVTRPFHFGGGNTDEFHAGLTSPQMPVRVIATPNTSAPEVQLLSNGRYHVMVTNAGSGYSRWQDLAITRWREDSTRDNWGAFLYVRDVATNTFWSTSHQPTLKIADRYEAIFSEGRAEFRRHDLDYEAYTEIVVSPEDDIELRRLRVTNYSQSRRIVELTSYCEVVIASAMSDELHPAFSNLFVQTEIIADQNAIVCTRRPRSANEQMPWIFALMVVRDAEVVSISYETDRSKFIGRTRSPESPAAMKDVALSGTSGSVLDPIAAIRYRISLDSQQTATVDWVCGLGDSRSAVLNLIGKYRDKPLADRVFGLTWTHSWVNLRQINATESDAQLYGRIAGSIIYANSSLRAPASVLIRNRRGQSGLWGYSISGDLPIVLVQISGIENIEFARQMVQAHAYWRSKGLVVDLVIWNEDRAGYRQILQEQIMGLVAASVTASITNRPGGIFVRAAEQISAEDRVLFETVARVVLTDTKGPLIDQLEALMNRPVSDDDYATGASAKSITKHWPVALTLPIKLPLGESAHFPIPIAARQKEELLFSSSLGGFSTDGREYVINTTSKQSTPAPWVNVLANPHFGCVISESGGAYTWSENAHEFRLTPWANDPVEDVSGEAIYIRDDTSGKYWSATPLPRSSGAPYQTRHGFGYSQFHHDYDGITSELTVFVDLTVAVKYSVLKLRNHSGRPRQISVTGYVEWVLGDLRQKSVMHVITNRDEVTGAICATNPYSLEFGRSIAFFETPDATSITADRTEFIGRNGSLANPAAMRRANLSNKIGAGMDSCAALRVKVDLSTGQEKEIVFRLGVVTEKVIKQSTQATQESLKTVRNYWEQTLGAVTVHTPDTALNLLCNGWLMYQTIACRLWARSGFYQSGGAFGFRDQLQDTMAIVHSRSELTREHLLRSAAHQFVEGDVQHWWHPPNSQGVRTRCSDDFLWLPQAVVQYISVTGDRSVLSEEISYIEGRRVNAGDDSYYDLPSISQQKSSLYQHCVKAINNGLNFGSHGLPLMGSGDWNDGMNLVGIEGKGESVWLAFFLYDTLTKFAQLAEQQGDQSFAERCVKEAENLQKNIEAHAWDGAWYKRAYFDNGVTLGSNSNEECQIDSISQSWSVLSGAADHSRSTMAMSEVSDRLVNRRDGVVQLLVPPFDRSNLNPGYIKGYVPGVRENGGQYTHSAIWVAMAFAKQGNKSSAWEVFKLINPVRHGISDGSVAAYKVEPYVIAADVYAVAPHVGRGGWTWYTGSAGWMYRLIVESLLGVIVEDGNLKFSPCIPEHWDKFSINYLYRSTKYEIIVTQCFCSEDSPAGTTIKLDGATVNDNIVPMVDDQSIHIVNVAIVLANVAVVNH